jgi:hypothetical protein
MFTENMESAASIPNFTSIPKSAAYIISVLGSSLFRINTPEFVCMMSQ